MQGVLARYCVLCCAQSADRHAGMITKILSSGAFDVARLCTQISSAHACAIAAPKHHVTSSCLRTWWSGVHLQGTGRSCPRTRSLAKSCCASWTLLSRRHRAAGTLKANAFQPHSLECSIEHLAMFNRVTGCLALVLALLRYGHWSVA